MTWFIRSEPMLGFSSLPLIAIPLFIRFGMYRAVMRYLGNDALIAIWKAVTISALVLSLVVYWNRTVTEAARSWCSIIGG
jgi:FlaA1/EpsC-like NDP-sugar epimerase